MKIKKAYGIARTRDRQGKVVKRSLKPYTMCLHTNAAGGRENMLVLIAEEYESDIETGRDNQYANRSQKDNQLLETMTEITLGIPQATTRGEIDCRIGGAFDWNYPESSTRRGRVQEDGTVSPTLCASNTGIMVFNDLSDMDKTTRPEGKGWVWDEDEELWFRIRRLTPRENFRLMDVKESDIDRMMSKETDKKGREVQAISNTQLYKCAGNSIVVAPMALTFENLLFPEATEQNNKQLTLF